MSKNITKSNKTSQKDNSLSVKQRNAIDLILLGKSDEEVAEEICVRRETVNRWKNQDSDFVYELRKNRKQVWGSQKDRLRGLISKAVNVLKENLDNEDPKIKQSVAIHILKSVGLYGTDLEPHGTEAHASTKAREKERMDDMLMSF